MANRFPFRRRFSSLALAVVRAGSAFGAAAQKPVGLLYVSYDPTRELYAEFNTCARGLQSSTHR